MFAGFLWDTSLTYNHHHHLKVTRQEYPNNPCPGFFNQKSHGTIAIRAAPTSAGTAFERKGRPGATHRGGNLRVWGGGMGKTEKRGNPQTFTTSSWWFQPINRPNQLLHMKPYQQWDILHMGVSKNRGGKPPKWMVKINGKPYEQMDDLGVPLFSETLIYY